jgi:hypothetical protein
MVERERGALQECTLIVICLPFTSLSSKMMILEECAAYDFGYLLGGWFIA